MQLDISRHCAKCKSFSYQIGGFKTLVEALEYAAESSSGVNVYSAFGDLKDKLSYRDLQESAYLTALKLNSLNLPRASLIGLLGETSTDFFRLFFACQYAGLIPCILPFQASLGGKQNYLKRLGHMIKTSGAPLLIVPQSLVAALQQIAPERQVLSIEQCSELKAISQSYPLNEADMAYVQFSSGSTAMPKGIVLSQRAVCSHLDRILIDGMRLGPDDRACSWLPMYHDMGLVGFFLAPIAGQCSVDYLPSTDFAKRPSLWLKLISENRCTITYAPAFAYQLAAQRIQDPCLNLASLRIAGIGGELIRANLLTQAAQALAPYGFNPNAWLPSYGMAENCLAISIANLEQGVFFSYRAEPELAAQPLIGCGVPLPDTQVCIRDEHNQAQAPGEIGHVWIKTPSLLSGYLQEGVVQQVPLDKEGFFLTGDLGYFHQEQLVITGRSNEAIHIRGRKLSPQDIEWVIQEQMALKPNDVAVFSIEGEEAEQVVALVQARNLEPKPQMHLLDVVRSHIQQQFGVSIKIKPVPARSLPMTSSGKLSRSQTRHLYLQGFFS